MPPVILSNGDKVKLNYAIKRYPHLGHSFLVQIIHIQLFTVHRIFSNDKHILQSNL